MIAGVVCVAFGGLAGVPGCVAAGRRVASAGSASALLTKAFADARAQGSFHQALVQISGKTRGTLDDDVTLHTGRQQLDTSDGAHGEVEVLGNTVYVSGNQRGLATYFKFSSGERAVIGSNWVSVPSTNSAFASIAYDVTVGTALEEVSPSGHLTRGPVTTVDGQRVIAISGGPPSGYSGGSGSRATLYVTATSDPLPVRASVLVKQGGHEETLTGTLSDWGEKVTVTPPAGALSAQQISALAGQLSGLSVAGEPGYFAVTGQQGQTVPYGRPWGTACAPIRLAVDRSVPSWIYAQISDVVAQTRKQGIDVVLESRGGAWRHDALYYRSGQSAATSKPVDIVAAGSTPAIGKNQPAMRVTTDSKADHDGKHDDLTAVTGAFNLQVVGHSTATVRRSIRQLIAWTQGISETTDPISGITQRSFTDRYTRSDLTAMLAMSGCARSSAGGTTVIGIAA